MSKKFVIPLVIIGILGVVGAFGFAATQVVQAFSPAQQEIVSLDFGKGGPGVGGVSDENLAAALGITVEKLQAAYKAANEEVLKQAVSSGQLTQAQADKLKEREAAGRPGRFPLKGIDYNAILAKALNISVDQLNAATQKAFLAGIDQAVAAGKMTQEQADNIKARQALATSTKFQSALKSAFEAAIKQAVADGLISQAQADKILSAAGERSGFGFPGVGAPGKGGPGGAPGFLPGGPGRGERSPMRPPFGKPGELPKQQATPKP